ncbi:uncharacterized protein LOC131221295 isoform X2 [Magnolia sinica]|uniref:uncharacterized protein LOC131221295 isoform X2 n=1 Tax=Magnolia sinica TaxID=86752 RepID=UPI00265A7AE8|nr:uncharacterized protein LOC131221295 isoform X2 [Magnolia sinica]
MTCEQYCQHVKQCQTDENSSMQNRSACSSSKFSLHGQKVQSSQSASKLNDKKNRPASNASTSRNFEASSSQWIFPKLTISPLRKIHLLDSDCDDPSSINDQPKDVKRVGASAKGRQYDPAQYVIGNQQKKAKISSNMPQTDDFWKDFTPKKNIKLATPALDEFCEEYFRSMKYVNVGPGTKEDIGMSSTTSLASNYNLDEAKLCFQKNNFREDVDHCGSLPNLLPPAYRYFHHNDPRIQRLVRDRLCYFFPIGATSQGRNQHSETAAIDYMGQFGQRDTPTQYPSQVNGTVNRGLKESSKKNNNLNNSNFEEAPQPSGNWVNPKSWGAIPRHAGKKRVRADGCSAGAGHWYTGQDGRKVYFTKNGQELTGRTAYRHYRKENGGGFKRARKKAASKKNSNKAASKKSSNKAASKMRSNKTGIKKRSKR